MESAATAPVPDSPEPRFEEITRLHVHGRGAVLLRLDGSGRVRVVRGRTDEFRFEGTGLPRHLPGGTILLAAARGLVLVRGMCIEVEFQGGTAQASLVGEFEFRDAQGRPLASASRGEGVPPLGWLGQAA